VREVQLRSNRNVRLDMALIPIGRIAVTANASESQIRLTPGLNGWRHVQPASDVARAREEGLATALQPTSAAFLARPRRANRVSP
jgi:hypothetical protein